MKLMGECWQWVLCFVKVLFGRRGALQMCNSGFHSSYFQKDAVGTLKSGPLCSLSRPLNQEKHLRDICYIWHGNTDIIWNLKLNLQKDLNVLNTKHSGSVVLTFFFTFLASQNQEKMASAKIEILSRCCLLFAVCFMSYKDCRYCASLHCAALCFSHC